MMSTIFSPKWWLSMLFSTFLTMCFIYIIKKVAGKYNIPVVSTVANEA